MAYTELYNVIPGTFIVAIVAIMLAISLALYHRLRSDIYIRMSGAFGVVLLLYLVLIFTMSKSPSSFAAFQPIIAVLTFVFTQWGVYSFFFTKKKKEQRYILAASGVALIPAVAFVFLNREVAVGVSCLLTLVLTGAAAFWIFPQYKRRGKYLLALISHAVVALLPIGFLFTKHLSIIGITLFISAIYLFLMFLVLFDRIIDVIYAINYSSKTDGLTGLFLKKYFIQKTQEAINEDEAAALIFCDIDRFKILNDTQGHQMGDVMLKFVANIMQEVVEDVGIAGRYGGEEMVALITDPDADPAELSELFRSRVEHESRLFEDGTPVTVSVGFSHFDYGLTAGDFIKQADDAMYKAKSGGRNRVMSYQCS